MRGGGEGERGRAKDRERGRKGKKSTRMGTKKQGLRHLHVWVKQTLFFINKARFFPAIVFFAQIPTYCHECLANFGQHHHLRQQGMILRKLFPFFVLSSSTLHCSFIHPDFFTTEWGFYHLWQRPPIQCPNEENFTKTQLETAQMRTKPKQADNDVFLVRDTWLHAFMTG